MLCLSRPYYCFIAFRGLSDTNVSGAISANTTWNLAGSPYIVIEDVTINAGITLTVESGVTVKFQNDRSLIIYGTISAIGTSAQRISFTGTTQEPDWWKKILVKFAGAATFDYCDI